MWLCARCAGASEVSELPGAGEQLNVSAGTELGSVNALNH